MCAPWVTRHTSTRYSSSCHTCTNMLTRVWQELECVLCHPWCTHRTSLVVKKNFFSFPVAVKNAIEVGPLVFLLWMFVITENIMKHPVFYIHNWYQLHILLQVMKSCKYNFIICSRFLTLAHVLPEDGISLLKHVGVVPLLFTCVWHCAFGWFNKWIHWLTDQPSQ